MKQRITSMVVVLIVLGLAACDLQPATVSVLPTPVSVIPTATSMPTSIATATPFPTQIPSLPPTAISTATPCPTSPDEPVRQLLFSSAECEAGSCWKNSSIYLIHSDGDGLRRIFQGQWAIYELALSPDGTKLAFAEDEGWGITVYILDLATGNTWPLMADFNTRMPRWVSDDQLLCIARPRISEGIDSIYLVNVDGQEWQQLTDFPSHRRFYDLAVSPDGVQFLFTEYDPAVRATVYRMNMDGTGLRELISPPVDCPIYVGWSPSGNWIVIYPIPSHSTDPVPIYLADRAGVETAEIAQLTGYPQLLAWTPDESEMIFFSCSPAAETRFGNVVAVRRDGSDTRMVVRVLGPKDHDVGDLCLSPKSLSPDQAQLAFSPMGGFRTGLYVTDMRTGCWRELISGSAYTDYSVLSILWIP